MTTSDRVAQLMNDPLIAGLVDDIVDLSLQLGDGGMRRTNHGESVRPPRQVLPGEKGYDWVEDEKQKERIYFSHEVDELRAHVILPEGSKAGGWSGTWDNIVALLEGD